MNKEKNKKTLPIVTLVVAAVVLISMGSYAMWQITRKQTNRNVVGSSCLHIELEEESAAIDLGSAFPISDSDGAELDPYTFTIVNECGTAVNYSVALESIANPAKSAEDYLNYSYLRVKLDDDEAQTYGELNILTSDTEEDEYTIRDTKEIVHHTLDGESRVTHNLRLWIKEDTPLQNEDNTYNMNKYFYGKIKIIAGQGIEGDTEEEIVEAPEPTDALCFTFTASTGTITKYTVGDNCPGNVVIPSEIDGVTVTAIGSSAFSSNGLTSVYIPYTIINIGYSSFEGNEITNVIFENTDEHPSQLTAIDNYAFAGNDLTSISIPASVTSIGSSAFGGNKLANLTFEDTILKPSHLQIIRSNAFAFNELTSLIIPGSTTSIENGAFYHNNLTSVEVMEGVNSLGRVSSSSCLVQTCGIFGGNKISNLTLPSTLTTIGNNVFYDNNITSLVIPDNVTTIGRYAFQGNNISQITIPSTLTTIENYAFKGNSLFTANDVTIEGDSSRFGSNTSTTWTNKGFPSGKILTNECYAYTKSSTSVTIVKYNPECGPQVNIPAEIDGVTLKKLEAYSFQSSGLTSVTIPNSVTTIGANAFQNNRLTSVTIPSGITKIDYYVFQNNLLENITIPASVTTISTGAFQGNRLTSITIPTTIKTLGNQAFEGNRLQTLIIEPGTQLTQILDGTFANNQLTSVTIPEGITSIGSTDSNSPYITANGAFANNNIESISLPSTLTTIGNSAFYNNSLSGTIKILNDFFAGSYAFGRNPNLSKIIVTTGSGHYQWNGTAEVEIADEQ